MTTIGLTGVPGFGLVGALWGLVPARGIRSPVWHWAGAMTDCPAMAMPSPSAGWAWVVTRCFARSAGLLAGLLGTVGGLMGGRVEDVMLGAQPA